MVCTSIKRDLYKYQKRPISGIKYFWAFAFWYLYRSLLILWYLYRSLLILKRDLYLVYSTFEHLLTAPRDRQTCCHTCMHVCIYIYTPIYIYIYIYIRRNAYIYLHTHTHTYRERDRERQGETEREREREKERENFWEYLRRLALARPAMRSSSCSSSVLHEFATDKSHMSSPTCT